jgi:UrcA family protein
MFKSSRPLQSAFAREEGEAHMISKLALAAVFGALAAPAFSAQTQGEGPTIVITRKIPPSADVWMRVVHIGDLNLRSSAGQQEMEKRVATAVDDICTIPTPLPSYKGRMEKPCRDEAWSGARPQMTEAIHRAQGS